LNKKYFFSEEGEMLSSPKTGILKKSRKVGIVRVRNYSQFCPVNKY